MKGLLKTVSVAGASFVAGYMLCRYTQENYYFNLAEQRVKQAEEELEKMRLSKLAEYAIADVATTEELFTAKHAAAVVEEVAGTALTSYQGGSTPGQPTDYTKFAGKSENGNVTAPQLPKYSTQPQFITEGEFVQAENSRFVTLYVGDDTLVNEVEQPMLGVSRTEMLGEFGGSQLIPKVDGEGNVYVYNVDGNFALQIAINMGEYSAEV